MPNGQINRLLEFANMQMAAEAFLSRDGDNNLPPVDKIVERLTLGNTHTNIFTPVQAEQFTNQYEVVTQYRNDPSLNGGTGFSATLFKKVGKEEYTLSFRSTEFIDDAVRDNISNQLEIKALGWAFGQISDMEKWYKNTLVAFGGPLEGKTFNVTGYSLGGHLATAFNILRREEAATSGVSNPISETYTFNGAGTGQILNGRQLTDLISDFNQIRDDYLASLQWNALSDAERLSIRNQAQARVNTINAELARVANIQGAQNATFDNKTAPLGDQAKLGYQIAALLVSRDAVGLSANVQIGGPLGVRSNLVPAPVDQRFSNMTEFVGMETEGVATSFVSNGGFHYGNRIEVPIEAQPYFRGNFLLGTLAAVIVNGSVKSHKGTDHGFFRNAMSAVRFRVLGAAS